MKRKVIIELPLDIANWLLLECDFHQAMLSNTLVDLDLAGSSNQVKRPLMHDLCNYGFVHNVLAKTLVAVVRK